MAGCIFKQIFFLSKRISIIERFILESFYLLKVVRIQFSPFPFLFKTMNFSSPNLSTLSKNKKKRKKKGGFFEHARSNLFIPHLIVLRYRGDTRVCELGGANINNAFFFSRWVNSRHGLKKEGSESPGEFSVANPKPSALSRITNVTELNPVAVVSDGAVGYCVICNFMHACPKRGERRKWRDFVVRVIARARK